MVLESDRFCFVSGDTFEDLEGIDPVIDMLSFLTTLISKGVGIELLASSTRGGGGLR